MKRSILLVILGLLAAAGLFAQSESGGTGGSRTPREPPTAVTVSGNLALVNGRIGLTSGGSTYYVTGIGRLIGFVEGLKEGAPVTLEGYEFPLPAAPEYRLLRVLKLSINGKDYETAPGLRQFAEGAGVGGPKFRDGPGYSGGRGPRHHFRNRR
jgi:hypothetical protein